MLLNSILSYISNNQVVKVRLRFFEAPEAMMTTTQQHSTKQDILQYLLEQGEATAQAIAESLNITPQAVRRHLKDLEGEDLIEYETVQVGMGRPQHIYQLSRKGRDRFPDSHGQFAVSLLDTLAETIGRDQVNLILRKQWERKGMEYRSLVGSGSLSDRVAKLVELRKAEGYMAECYPIESNNCKQDTLLQFMFMEHHCAISDVAETFPSVCGHELEMFAMILPDCTIERTHWQINGEHRCGYLITAGTIGKSN